MFLHLGENVVLKDTDIIGIFDLDNTTVSKVSRNFLECMEKKGKVINVSEKLPKSFLVSEYGGEDKVYISQMSPLTLNKRNQEFSV